MNRRRSAAALGFVAALTFAGQALAASARDPGDVTLRTLVQHNGGMRTGSVRHGNMVKNLGEAVGVFMELELGRKFGSADHDFHDKAARDALWAGPTGVGVSWRNYRTGATGVVTPRAAATLEADGDICRLFEDSIVQKSGETFTRSARVCLGKDRIWRID